jgi:hypothetical protein
MSVEPDFAAQRNPSGGLFERLVLAEMLPVTFISSRAWRRTDVLGDPEFLIPVPRSSLGQGSVSKNILDNAMEGYAIERLGRIPTG